MTAMIIDHQTTPFDGIFYAELILNDGRTLSYQRPFKSRANARAFAKAAYDDLVARRVESAFADHLPFGNWFYID